MLKILEDVAKSWLSENRFPVPRGCVASTPEEAARAVAQFRAGAFVKALVPANRRAKAGAVLFAHGSDEGFRIASNTLGRTLDGVEVKKVYVEERVEVHNELFLAFEISAERPQVIVSRHGGVDIESIAKNEPTAIVRAEIDPLRGIRPWEALELWKVAGISGHLARQLGTLTSELFSLFQRDDLLVLEINPLVVDAQSNLSIVGALVAVDDSAVERHPRWESLRRSTLGSFGITLNKRERRVAETNLAVSGGECRYVECDGDIGLLVGGGGAGLYQHDRIIAAGGRPANHCVTPPTGKDPSKLHAVINAILDNPRVRGLLVGFNFAQMARVDVRAQAVVDAIRERKIDATQFPVVLRLFGPGEQDAREAAASVPGLHYLDRGESLDDGVERIVEMVRACSYKEPM